MNERPLELPEQRMEPFMQPLIALKAGESVKPVDYSPDCSAVQFEVAPWAANMRLARINQPHGV